MSLKADFNRIEAQYGLAWLCVTTPIYFIGSFWFYRRRNVQPIKARQPYLVLLGCFGFYLLTLNMCIVEMTKLTYPCTISILKVIGVDRIGSDRMGCNTSQSLTLDVRLFSC